MTWPLAVVIIVMMVVVGKVMSSRYRAQAGIIEDKQGNQQWVGNGNDAETQREVEDLRERIKVLERIATEGNSLDAAETKRISAEIEALRDKQAD